MGRLGFVSSNQQLLLGRSLTVRQAGEFHGGRVSLNAAISQQLAVKGHHRCTRHFWECGFRHIQVGDLSTSPFHASRRATPDWVSPCSFQMPSSTQLAYFAAFLGSGLFFLIVAFSLFLPVIILAPSKFAICFTIGSVLVLSAFVSLRGWQNQLAQMLSSDRLLFTLGEPAIQLCDALHTAHKCPQILSNAAYLGSMGGTLYAALGMHSYVLSLVCCAAQVRLADARK